MTVMIGWTAVVYASVLLSRSIALPSLVAHSSGYGVARSFCRVIQCRYIFERCCRNVDTVMSRGGTSATLVFRDIGGLWFGLRIASQSSIHACS